MITRACKASPDWMRIGAVPGVLAGIVVTLAATNTTLNIESFMGSIMCLGVSVSGGNPGNPVSVHHSCPKR